MAYSKELKASIIANMLPPNDISFSKISREEGICRTNSLLFLKQHLCPKLSLQSTADQKVSIQKKCKSRKMLVCKQMMASPRNLPD